MSISQKYLCDNGAYFFPKKKKKGGGRSFGYMEIQYLAQESRSYTLIGWMHYFRGWKSWKLNWLGLGFPRVLRGFPKVLPNTWIGWDKSPLGVKEFRASVMDWHPIQCVFPPHAQRSRDRLHDSDQDKTFLLDRDWIRYSQTVLKCLFLTPTHTRILMLQSDFILRRYTHNVFSIL